MVFPYETGDPAETKKWMAEIGARTKVAVSIIGKVKTALQMIAILLLLYKAPLGQFPTHAVGVALLYIAAILTLWSMFVYLRAAWPILSRDEGCPDRSAVRARAKRVRRR